MVQPWKSPGKLILSPLLDPISSQERWELQILVMALHVFILLMSY